MLILPVCRHNIGSWRFMLIMPTSCPNISGVIGRVYSLHQTLSTCYLYWSNSACASESHNKKRGTRVKSSLSLISCQDSFCRVIIWERQLRLIAREFTIVLLALQKPQIQIAAFKANRPFACPFEQDVETDAQKDRERGEPTTVITARPCNS